jgi:sarcosine oxidase subunit gamma
VLDLIAKHPANASLPIAVEGVTLSLSKPAFITSIAPYKGQSLTLSTLLKKTYKLDLPAVCRTHQADDNRLLWFGHNQYLLISKSPPEPAIANFAAMTDQSDAWTVLLLEGPLAAAALAHHCPLDLRPSHFDLGQTARAPVAHLPSVVTPVNGGFEIMFMQSLVKTGMHHLYQAMLSVSAQQVFDEA